MAAAPYHAVTCRLNMIVHYASQFSVLLDATEFTLDFLFHCDTLSPPIPLPCFTYFVFAFPGRCAVDGSGVASCHAQSRRGAFEGGGTCMLAFFRFMSTCMPDLVEGEMLYVCCVPRQPPDFSPPVASQTWLRGQCITPTPPPSC